MSPRAGKLLATLGLVVAAGSAQAQGRNRIVVQADSALAAGNLRLADSLYFYAARVRPRDPEVRTALGKYLGGQGKAKVAVVLLEEARMFGGDPVQVGRELAPLYQELGEWRALLTMPGSSLTGAERRRAAWLSEHAFGAVSDAGSTSLIGAPAGDTIARVAVRVNGVAAVASIVGTDAGFVIGSRLASSARSFGDSASVVFDSIAVGSVKFLNVPATIGATASTVAVSPVALGRMVLTIDYGRSRVSMSRTDAGAAEARHLLMRAGGQLRVLEAGRWRSLGEFATAAAQAKRAIAIDVAAGEVRVRR